ncbi:ABC transporter substrate-binding protein [Vallitalea pronyensis]|uniref:ABC transporter substrate-binding protein n=1 Tax=Vallitalea pronyensis TaxID=1348613 RepID=A0A8J8MMX4_9FIRM|nr:ABC transporter substrate-binding protein [Vallitalea pronyensis]QUI24710.1 ABC transporter substrate-binding protein [Vallitalea pronyensis]
MKIARKILALMMVTALLVTIMVGCGQKAETNNPTPATGDTQDNTNDKDDDKDEQPDETADSALEHVTLTWYFIGNGQQEDVKKVEEEVNAYIKDKINASIKLQCFDWGSYDQKMRTMIAGTEKFDICFTSSWTNNYFQQAARGAFIPLNDYFDEYLPKTIEQLGDDFIKGSQIEGINYAIPANKEKAHQWGFIIRKDMIEKYNMDISTIKTLEDIEPFLKTIKENEPNMYALEALNGESPFKLLDFDRIGDDKYPGVVWNDSKDMKVFNEFEAEETMTLFKTMHKFYKAGYIREDAATVRDYMADEKAGKIFAAVKSLKPGKDDEMTNSTGHPWVQVEITPPIISNRDTTGSMQAVSRTSKNPERALMFLELFNTDPYINNLINFGIEGEHYTKVSDNIIESTDNTDKYSPGTGWMFGNQFINYLLPNEDPEKWEKFKTFNDQASGTKTLGFMFNADSIKTEIAQCNNVWDEYVPALETGTVDPEEYLPILLQGFKDAGIDKIINEKQKQLDAWLGN